MHMFYMLHIRCCVHEVLCMHSLCTCCLLNVLYKMAQIVLCEYFICSARYRWCYVHDRYEGLYAYGDVHLLDMYCCVQMIICTCWICSAMHIWCSMHVVHMVLCTYGVLCALYIWCSLHDCTSGIVSMWCLLHVVHRVLCACGVVCMLCM